MKDGIVRAIEWNQRRKSRYNAEKYHGAVDDHDLKELLVPVVIVINLSYYNFLYRQHNYITK